MRLKLRSWLLLLATLSFLALQGLPVARADMVLAVAPGFQSKLVELFSKNQCDEILRQTNPDIVRALRPNVMAIVASCDPPWESAEKIFKSAEALSPTGDLILVLHARYRTQKDYDSAAPIWNKVLLTARNPAFRQMAEDYFAGEKVKAAPINLSANTVFGSVLIGGGQETNPRPDELDYLPTHASGALFSNGNFTWMHWFPWGSVATQYGLTYNNFFSESQFSLIDQSLNIPFALHLSSNKDIVFSPLAGWSILGGSLYQAKYGISVSGVVYNRTYKQLVEGAVFQDNYYLSPIVTESAAHYRFQYSWQFFPKLTSLSGLLRIEHASAGTSSTFNQFSGSFPFSHTDVGVKAEVERTFKHFLLGVETDFAYRFDSDDSIFPNSATGEIIDKKRVDKIFGVQPSITFALSSVTQLYAWFRYDRVWSDLGQHSYVNYNLTDYTSGLALKASFSSY